MAPVMESQYKDLLTPIKDPEKSFAVNISELLQTFVSDLVKGKIAPNFNSAALLLQGSASVYGKKVEYLHNLATQLHTTLLKQKKNEEQQKKKDPKEKTKKEEKVIDPFLSIEIKPGKNLSCLKKKNNPKTASKKSQKKIKNLSIPVHLLSNDNDDKGEVFYDTRGDIVGNKGDFAINKCRLTNSGWLLLPTVNPNLVPSLELAPDFYDDSDHSPGGINIVENGDGIGGFDDIQASPDEGFESYPASSDVQQLTPATDVNSQESNKDPTTANAISDSAPPSTDEGIGETPNSVPTNMEYSPGAENIPAEDGEEELENQAPMPVRQSTRQALKTCQLAIEDDPLAGINVNKELLKRKAIEKKNVRRLPDKLKNDGPPPPLEPITLYCARTFFSMDDKALRNSLLKFDTKSFEHNSNFLKRISDKLEALKTSDRRNKHIAPIEDEREIDVEGIEVSRDANEDDETLNYPFDDNDIQIDHENPLPECPMALELPEGDNALPGPSIDMPIPDITHIAQEECENYTRELHQFVQNSDITQRVHEWEKDVKPFLDELEQRESFDINLYGSRILNSFEDTNRKQTKTFRQFCKQKEKWEIHRYFMALLPLANIGNVELDSEPREDGTEEIYVTLLSRKMHHKELEEFGHNDGSHS